MKTKAISIQIPHPCQQNLDAMENIDGQKFCSSCQKTVIDFRGLPHSEIVATVYAAGNKKICGRLTNTQLQRLEYQLISIPNSNNWLKYLGVLAIGTLMLTEGCAKHELKQNKPLVTAIHGYVTDENRLPLNGVKVAIANTNLTAITAADGSYEIKLPQQFNTRHQLLVVDDFIGSASLRLDYLRSAQDTVLVKTIEYAIAGEIAVLPANLKR